jgi:hypothetical protein
VLPVEKGGHSVRTAMITSTTANILFSLTSMQEVTFGR